KVENQATIAVKNLDDEVQRVVECVPVEHMRGLGRIVFVDRIEDPRLDAKLAATLPVLYHPRMPGTPTAFGEIALPILFPPRPSGRPARGGPPARSAPGSARRPCPRSPRTTTS